MISKPLFKQSCKANFGIWTFVTFTTCFMLAIVILVLGNLNVNEIRSSMSQMFIEDAIESTIEEQSMTYFCLENNSLQNYDKNYIGLKYLLQDQMTDEVKSGIIQNYNDLINGGNTDEQARQYITSDQDENQIKAINTMLNYYLIQGEIYTDAKISEYVLNEIAETIYNHFLESDGEETANNVKIFISSAIQSFVTSGVDSTTEFTTSYIPSVLKSVFYGQSFDYNGEILYISNYFNQDQIYEKSYTSIITFRAELSVKENQISQELSLEEGYSSLTEEEIQTEISTRLATYIDSMISDLSESLVEQLPEKVSRALSEIGDMDVYGLVLGSIFYRIAGLLLPMIYVIMTANNLIAGQVDTGSMAYVLSTPTKRRTVSITQMAFLISSLFAMFLLTTLTSLICFTIINSVDITITFSHLLLFNLGAFLTMFAVSGICFLASSWFNRSKLSMAWGGGLTMFFLVATILGLFGSSVIPSAIRISAMNYFNYASIITLFDVISILNGSIAYLWKFGFLILIGILTYIIGLVKFKKKDLPL